VSDFFAAYGLFLAQLATFVLLVVVAIAVIAATRRRGRAEGLVVEHLNRRYEDSADELKVVVEGKARFKKETKARDKQRKREEKARSKQESPKPRLFVLDFKGDLRASAAASLREEVSAIVRVARPQDRVLLRLENSGGTVHEHGFAASQLLRLKRHGLVLLVAVDKVAASGGYLMACVADRLIAAPFAIIGSIGVLAQLPNFHRLLEEKGVDFSRIQGTGPGGRIVELRCTYDPATKGGDAPDGRKVKGTIHWVSAAHALDAEVRLYDHLFGKADPDDVPEGQDYTVNLNPASLERLTGCKVEPSLTGAAPLSRYQFERQGYFCVDADSSAGTLVFNRTVALRDSWAKIEKAQQDS